MEEAEPIIVLTQNWLIRLQKSLHQDHKALELEIQTTGLNWDYIGLQITIGKKQEERHGGAWNVPVVMVIQEGMVQTQTVVPLGTLALRVEMETIFGYAIVETAEIFNSMCWKIMVRVIKFECMVQIYVYQ